LDYLPAIRRGLSGQTRQKQGQNTEPADSQNKWDDPTGSLSVREENDLDFGSEEESFLFGAKTT